MMSWNDALAKSRELPRWAWLWFPPILVLIELGWRLVDEDSLRRIWDSEHGPVENATVLVLVPGIIAGVLLLWRYRDGLPTGRIAGWAFLVTLGAFYFGGEEISWGQQWLGWATPDVFQVVNDQHETNLHNISSWMDQKPRFLLEMWVLFGGVIYQFRRGERPGADDWRAWFWPTPVVLPTALLATLIALPDRLDDWFHWGVPVPFDVRLSEIQEYYFALFLTLYLCSLYVRARKRWRGGVKPRP